MSTTPATDYQTQIEQAQLARELRKQILIQSMKDGQAQLPVQDSGRFLVAPHWTQALSAVLGPAVARQDFNRSNDEVAAIKDAEARAAQRHMEAFPSQQNTVPFKAPGIDDADAASASVTNKAYMTPAQVQGARVEWAKEGRRLPSLRDTVQKVMDDAIKEPEREEARQFRAEQAAEGRQIQRDSLAERARQAQDRLELQSQGLDLQAQALDLRKLIASQVNGKTPTTPADKPGKTLSSKVVADIGAIESDAGQLTNLKNSYNAKFGPRLPGSGNVEGTIGQLFGTDASNWYSGYAQYANQVRNRLFGSALTRTEADAFDKAMITENTPAAEVPRRLAQQEAALVAARNKLVENHRRAGYDTSGFEPMTPPNAPGYGGGATGEWGAKGGAGSAPQRGWTVKVK